MRRNTEIKGQKLKALASIAPAAALLILPVACTKPAVESAAKPTAQQAPGAGPLVSFALCGTGLPESGMWKCDPIFADVNGDGFLDLAAIPRLGTGPRFWFGDGAGNWRESSAGLAGERSCGGGMAFGDANNDKKLDLIVADHCEGVYVYLGDAQGTWTVTTTALYPKELIPDGDPDRLSMFLGAEDLDIGDVNRDGNLDILAAGSDDGGVSVYLGDGTGQNWTRLPAGTLNATAWANRVRLFDINTDGKLDVIATHGDGPRVWLAGEETGKWIPSFQGLPEPIIKGLYTGMAIGDINADSRPDLAIANWVDGPEVYLQQEDGSWKKTEDVFPKMRGGAMGIDLADVDHDGHLDMAVSGRLEGEAGFIRGVFILMGNGGTSWEYREDSGLPATGLATTPGVTFADINHDGVMDLTACSGLIVETVMTQTGPALPQHILMWCGKLPAGTAPRPKPDQKADAEKHSSLRAAADGDPYARNGRRR